MIELIPSELWVYTQTIRREAFRIHIIRLVPFELEKLRGVRAEMLLGSSAFFPFIRLQVLSLAVVAVGTAFAGIPLSWGPIAADRVASWETVWDEVF